ncbi:MAG: poly-beta-1,6 N-acetyl-D-glucosamine export porin PgaA, partial [Pusillimonas sp.]|nr:poly-beta-1,6 N-acetyl-D-glucosamine export porin PgaA [Pusillimonas sp.]
MPLAFPAALVLALSLSFSNYAHSRTVAPALALHQEAAAQRDARHWNKAISLYEQGMAHYSNEPRFAVGLTMTLADAGKIDQGRAQGSKLMQRWPKNPDAYIAAAYVEMRAQQPYAALALIDKAYELAPQLAYVQREYIFALQRAGLAVPASRLSRKYPDLLTSSQKRELQGDVLAERTRLASLPARPETQRFNIADRVLADYARTITAWQAEPDSGQAIVRLRLDRLSALHARKRYENVIQEYEALKAEGVTIPDYALSVVASSYLTLRQPEMAAQLYKRIVQTPNGQWREPRRADDEIGLYYALLESGHYEEAMDVITQAYERQPLWLYIPGQPERLP